MSKSALFADRFASLAVTGPLVRIQFGALELPRAEGQSPQLVPTQVLVMPVEGFAASFGMLEAMMNKLLADGVLKQQAPTKALDNAPPAATKQ